MRQYTEPTCRHLLRQSLIFGIPVVGVLILSGVTVSFQLLACGNMKRSCIGFGISTLSYGLIRLFTRYSKIGWDQSILFFLERISARKSGAPGKIEERITDFEVISPDTIDDNGLLNSKQIFEDMLKHLKLDETLILRCQVTQAGAKLTEIKATEICNKIRKKTDLNLLSKTFLQLPTPFIYSCHNIPVTSDPLWLFSHLKDFPQDYQVIISFRGIEQNTIKGRIEAYRRLNSQLNDRDEVDSDISYEDASHVLRGLSRGDECVVEMSLVIASSEELPLDSHFFLKEKSTALPILSILGLRARSHRAHYVRVVTGTDLIPHILDPFETGSAILKTLRGKPLYFDPQDPRLDALHWLVARATLSTRKLSVLSKSCSSAVG